MPPVLIAGILLMFAAFVLYCLGIGAIVVRGTANTRTAIMQLVGVIADIAGTVSMIALAGWNFMPCGFHGWVGYVALVAMAVIAILAFRMRDKGTPPRSTRIVFAIIWIVWLYSFLAGFLGI